MGILLLGTAHAQAVDAHGFSLAAFDADARDPLSVQRPGAFEGGSGFVGAVFEYAKATRAPAGAPPLDNLFVLDIGMGFAPHPRLRFDAFVPAYGFTGLEPDGALGWGLGLADARVAAMIVLIRPPAERGFGLALVPHVDAPTGWFHPGLGRQTVAGGGSVAATLEQGPFTATTELGYQREPASGVAGRAASDALRFGAAVGVMLDPQLGLNVEAVGRLPVTGPDTGIQAAPVELIGALRHAGPEGVHFIGGAAVGLTDAIGVADLRLFVGGGFGGGGGPGDRDADGIPDRADACPLEPEVVNGYLDEDGCPDFRPTLRAWASLGGDRVAGATLRLEGPVVRETRLGAEPFLFEVDPGTVWRGTARLGPCLIGERVITASDRSVDLDIPLALQVVGSARVQVLGLDGQPTAGATVRIVPEHPHCAPDEILTTDARGEVKFDLGPGTHGVEVRQGGGRGSGSVRVEDGRELRVIVPLEGG